MVINPAAGSRTASSTPTLDTAGASLDSTSPAWDGLGSDQLTWSAGVHETSGLSWTSSSLTVEPTGYQTFEQTGHDTSRNSVKVGRAGLTAKGGMVLRGEDDGDSHGTFGGVAAQVDSNGMRAGTDVSVTGAGSTAQTSMLFGTDGFTAAAGATRIPAEGSTFGAAGAATIGPDGIKLGGTGSMSHTWAPVTLGDPGTSPAGYDRPAAGTQAALTGSLTDSVAGDVTAERPVQTADGRWLVAYTYSASASRRAGAGLSWTGLEPGGSKDIGGMSGVSATGSTTRLGASAGATAGATLGGSRSFDTEDEAMRFYRMPMPSAELLPPTDPASAAELRQGERRTVQVSLTGSAGLTAGGTGLPSVSAGASAGVSATLEIERAEGSWVEVTIAGGAQAGASSSIGAAGLDVGGQTQMGGRLASTWRMDLDTQGGADAYEGLLAGQLPEEGPGVQPPTTTEAMTDGTHANVGLPGLTFQIGSERVDETVRRPDGTQRQAELGAESQKVSWWRIFGDATRDVDADIGATAVTERDGSGEELDSQVLITARTASNDASSNYEALSRAAGLGDAAGFNLGPSTPGTWDLTTEFGPHSLNELKKAACDDKWGEPDILRSLTPAQRRFIEDMRAAPDRATERQVVQEYGQNGPATVAWLRTLLKAQGTTYVALEESPTWIGPDGWATAEKTFEGGVMQAEQAQDLQVLRRLQTKHRARLYDLGDHGRYPEVPERLRSDERNRTYFFVQRVERAIATHGGDVVPDSPHKAILEQIRERTHEVDKQYAAVRKAMKAHGVGARGLGSAWHKLGQEGSFPWQADGPAANEYREAQAALAAGVDARRRAGEELAEASESAADPMSLDDPSTLYEGALASLDAALANFTQASTWLAWIEETYPAYARDTH